MALLARPLDVDCSQFFRGVFENRGRKITQPHMGQKFCVERISFHSGFIQNLMVPDDSSGALTQGKWNARVERRELLDVRNACDIWQTDRAELDRSLCRFVDDFQDCARRSEEPACGFLSLRHLPQAMCPRIDTFSRRVAARRLAKPRVLMLFRVFEAHGKFMATSPRAAWRRGWIRRYRRS